jgi:hypothetical protein
VTSIVIIASCLAVALSFYAVLNSRTKEDQFDHKAFVKDINDQLKVMQTRIHDLVEENIREVKGEYKEGFDLTIEHNEKLADHVNKNFSRLFENCAELDNEIKLLLKKLDKTGIKSNAKRGRPRKNTQ